MTAASALAARRLASMLDARATFRQVAVLQAISAREEPYQLSELAAMLDVGQGVVNRIAAQFERDGLARRTAHRNSDAAVALSPTIKGRRLADQVGATMAQAAV